MYLRVALDVPLFKLFDYRCDEPVEIGQRVLVPFGNRSLIGVVMARVEQTDAKRVKSVEKVLSDCLPLSDELLKLLNFCSDYYRYPIGPTVLAALPVRLRSDKPLLRQPAVFYQLSASGQALDLAQWPKRKQVQLKILTQLQLMPCRLAQLKSLASTVAASLKELIAAGWVEESGSTLPRVQGNTRFQNAHALTEEQQAAVDAVVTCNGYRCFLLYGITGSGKTEVYVHLMYQMLQRGGQILLLVPEINLTPQLEHYFRQRFPDVNLVSLHSELAETERLQNWQEAQAGYAQIVLGTRLSVFAELPKLNLIIVDEAHDGSFKQQDGLRYSARDVAVFRASQRGIPIVLGSATPALETYYHAQTGRYQLLKLTGRAQASARLPQVRCVNTNQTTMVHGVSENLLRALEERLARQEQSLVFINRRGYAPVLLCASCGWISGCKHCAGKMVLHLSEQRLRCHHCGFQQRVHAACPDCGSPDLNPIGSGTQRIEEVLQQRLPNARILRVDRDSTRSKRAWEEMRAQIQAKQVDILVGTQMLAKGHDFPSLTLVGVLNPDSALYSCDFRAPERLYAQLAQVAGRAGRADKPGEVIIQTEFPDHPLYRLLQKHDFDAWAASQLAERKLAGFPPYVFQAMLRAESLYEDLALNFMQAARRAAQDLQMEVDILGIVPASLARRANHVRMQMLIQCDKRPVLQRFLQCWQPLLATLPSQKIFYALDVDPADF